MKTAKSIPTNKLSRAGKILKTGLKVGKNYASYYGEKIIRPEVSKEKLNKANAADIMDSLQELRGGGLKVAQMLSMEKNLLPQEYVDQFSLAQFSVPPLSRPLVKKTFKKYFGAAPEDVFDEFNYESRYAASIGQVHEAWKDGLKLAVKIQYPGVGESIASDLAMMRPLAGKLLGLNTQELGVYFEEVESKLIEETDYSMELQQSMEISAACAGLKNIVFPKYLPEYSNERIITMEWIEGTHLSDYCKQDLSKDERNRVGQILWDLYMYQVHELRKMHADPHPGNILITAEGKIALIDFGCIKEIPADFYGPYSRLQNPAIIDDEKQFAEILTDLGILLPDDTEREREFFYGMFHELLSLALTPYRKERFDFSDAEFLAQMAEMGERMSKESIFSDLKPNRGSKHFIYTNRTMFGLYNLLHMLGAEIETSKMIVAA